MRNLTPFKIIIACILLTSSCSEKSSQPQNPAPEKPQSKNSCQNLSLFQDFAITGDYFRKLVSCLHDPSNDSSSLSTSIELMDQLGDDGLQNVLDLLLSPHPDSENQDVAYPYLGVLSVLAHRASLDFQGAELRDPTKRFQNTQSILTSLAPQEAAKTILYWAEKGYLEEILEELGLAIDKLPDGFISGYTREFLTGELRQELIQISQELLDREDNFHIINNSLSTKQFHDIEKDSLQNCVMEQGPCQRENRKKSFSQFFLEFWNGQEPNNKQKLGLSIGSMVKDSLQLDIKELSAYMGETAGIFRRYVNTDKNAGKKMGTLLHLSQETSLNEIKNLMSALQMVRSNPTYFDALQEKVGSSMLQKGLMEFLWNGGQASSCEVPFPGLKTAKDKQEFIDLLGWAMNPPPECQSSIIEHWALDHLELSCQGTCNKLEETLDFNQRLSPKQWQDLLSYSIDEMLHEISLNPYYLVDRNLSFQPWPKKALADIRQLQNNSKVTDIQSYLEFKKKFESLESIKDLIPQNFLDSSLSRSIEGLSSTSHHFQSLFSMKPESDVRLQRILAGVYPRGPASQVIAKNLTPQNLAEKLASPHSLSHEEWSLLFSSAADSHAYFRNPEASFKGKNEGFQFKLPFSIQNPELLGNLPSDKKKAQYLSLANVLWQGDEWSWSLHQRFWDKQAIHTASLPFSKAEDIRSWLTEEAQTQINQRSFWDENLPTQLRIPRSLIISEDYSAEEFRLLSLFASQNYLANAANLEGLSWKAYDTERLNKNHPIRAAFGPAAITGSARAWSAYQLFNNGLLGKRSLRSTASQWSLQEDQIRADLNRRRQSPQLVSQGNLNTGDKELLSSHEKDLLLLNSASFIYESRDELYFQPLFSFGNHCSVRSGDSWQRDACPGSVNSFTAYQELLSSKILNAFCPLLSQKQGMSEQRLITIRRALNFDDSHGEIEKLCSKALSSTTEPGLPINWIGESLATIAQLGKNPKLPMALKTLPTRLSLARTVFRNKSQDFLVEALAHTPSLNGLGNSIILQRKGLYQNLSANAPQFLDFVLANLSRKVGIQDFSAALKNLSAQADPGYKEPLARSLDLILDEYDKGLNQGDSLLSFIVNVLDKFAQDPQLSETLGLVAGNSHDPYTGILLSYTLPQAFKANVFKDFSWNDSQYYILKSLLDRNLLVSSQLTADMIQDDFLALSRSIYRVNQLFPSSKELDKVLRPLVSELSRALIAMDWDGELTSKMRDLSRLQLSSSTVDSLSKLFLSLNSPLADLNNQWRPKPAQYIDQLILAIMDHLPRLMVLTEGKFPESQDKLLHSAATMISSLEDNLGAKESFTLLQDSRLGFRDSEIMMELLRNEDLRSKLVSSLKTMERVEPSTAIGAIEELEQMIPEAASLLNFVNERVVLEGKGALDIRQLSQGAQFMSQNPALMKQNMDLMKIWLGSNLGVQEGFDD